MCVGFSSGVTVLEKTYPNEVSLPEAGGGSEAGEDCGGRAFSCSGLRYDEMYVLMCDVCVMRVCVCFTFIAC